MRNALIPEDFDSSGSMIRVCLSCPTFNVITWEESNQFRKYLKKKQFSFGKGRGCKKTQKSFCIVRMSTDNRAMTEMYEKGLKERLVELEKENRELKEEIAYLKFELEEFRSQRYTNESRNV